MAAGAIAAAWTTIFLLLLVPFLASAGIVAPRACHVGAQSGERELCGAEEQDDEDPPLLFDGMSMMQTIRSVEAIQASVRNSQKKERVLNAEAAPAPEQTNPRPDLRAPVSKPAVAVPLVQAAPAPEQTSPKPDPRAPISKSVVAVPLAQDPAAPAPEQTNPQPDLRAATSKSAVAAPLAQAIEPDARQHSATSTVMEEYGMNKYFYTTVVVSLTVFLALVAVSLLFALTLRDPVRKPREDCCLSASKAFSEPELSLQKVGASFVVPLKRISRCRDTSLCFDIPVLGAEVPLTAMLSRPAKEQPWTKLTLTVDVLMASDLPPLFTCTPFPGDAARPEPSQAGSPWLVVHNGKGTPVASVVVLSDGRCALRRWALAECCIEGSFSGPEPWISLSDNGGRIARAVSAEPQLRSQADAELGTDEGGEDRGCTPEQEFRIDTETDTQSPDSCLLLLVMLALVVFPAPKAKTPPSVPESPVISAARFLIDAAAPSRVSYEKIP